MSDQTKPKNAPSTGAIFKNDRKTSDNAPDYTGLITLPDGQEMRISGWIKEGKTGVKFMSLALSEKQQQATRRPANTFL